MAGKQLCMVLVEMEISSTRIEVRAKDAENLPYNSATPHLSLHSQLKGDNHILMIVATLFTIVKVKN